VKVVNLIPTKGRARLGGRGAAPLIYWRPGHFFAQIGFPFLLRARPVSLIALELPLNQRVANRLRLIGECAEEVDMLQLAVLGDDDADGNGIKFMVRKKPGPRAIIFLSLA
jgi:hypothetical protein